MRLSSGATIPRRLRGFRGEAKNRPFEAETKHFARETIRFVSALATL
jgi:hypothetical protein